MLVITPDAHGAIVAHAIAGLPNEACGLVGTRNGVADVFIAVANAAESATRFVLEPVEMLDAEAQLHESGREVVAVMHSHVDTSAYPSPTDFADAQRYDPDATLLHVIVSLRHTEPALRCYSLAGGQITEVPIELATDEPIVDDGEGPAAAVARLPQPPQ